MIDKRIGLWTASLDGATVREVVDVASTLDRQGWPSLWFGEGYGREAFNTAALVLSHSDRMRVGTGIASVYGRDAMASAAAARTLHAQHRGRFSLGLGISHGPLVEMLRGQTYGKPVATMSAYLDALGAAPAVVPGEADLPDVIIAALGPKMLELARDRAQGATTYLVAPEHTRQAREALGPEARLVVEQAAVVTPGVDRDEWRRRAHEHLDMYTQLPNYQASFKRQGFDDSDVIVGGSEHLKAEMVMYGTDATITRVEEHLSAGADEVLIQALGTSTTTPPRSDWALLAEMFADS